MTPTILPKKSFDCLSDAQDLHKALKGLTADETTIIELLSRRNHTQRLEIVEKFRERFYGQDPLKSLEARLIGHFEDVVIACLTPLPEFYARELHRAIAGLGTNEAVLIEILCSLSNSSIKVINEQYKRLYKTSLEDDIRGDTSGNFQRLLVTLCQGKREENSQVDLKEAAKDANLLFSAGEVKLDTVKEEFISVLSSRSFAHLDQMFREYYHLTGTTFARAVKAEFSGDIQKGLLAIVKCVRSTPEYFAQRLYKSMSGIGTCHRTLIRIIVTRSEVDLQEIRVAYQQMYNKSLAAAIVSETSGDYKRMLLALIGK